MTALIFHLACILLMLGGVAVLVFGPDNGRSAAAVAWVGWAVVGAAAAMAAWGFWRLAAGSDWHLG